MRRLLPALVVLCGCGAGVQARSGIDALLYVRDAQFFAGAFPQERGGPAVGSLRTLNQTLRVGQTTRDLGGPVDPSAVSVAIGLDGDRGYWVKPVGGTDPVLGDKLSFDASLGFSRFVTEGEHDVRVAASDAAGHFGAPSTLRYTFVELNAPPAADLSVSLSWDVDADLDLHVVEPDGKEIWARKITTYEPPVVGPIDQAEADAAGRLDFDSNGNCALDGRRLENVSFGAAPKGHYLVRIDTFSLCGQAEAHWKLAVTRQGEPVTTTTGVSLPSATRFPHERGGGALAAEFDVP